MLRTKTLAKIRNVDERSSSASAGPVTSWLTVTIHLSFHSIPMLTYKRFSVV